MAETLVVEINAKNLDRVIEIAKTKFVEESNVSIHKALFSALNDYIIFQGGEPGFKVKL